ncbi:HEPN domain-containing protein [Pedobacter jeongneungensis]|uniref:HEPN domain-containing protein n=1 Tax=Pedobacter jeongneungensis TaxID=947309 RepID=UPI000468E94F|nr:HEPN domain-containing protein [Pedobacter jeongneungensis]
MENFEIKLKTLLSEVIKELMGNVIPLVTSQFYNLAIKRGYFTVKNTPINGRQHGSVIPGQIIDESIMRMAITEVIESFESTKELCDLMSSSGKWYNNAKVGSTRGNFDIINSLPAAFITRIFVLGGHTVNAEVSNFEIAFSELLTFLNKQTVDYTLYIHLSGVYGTVEEIKIAPLAIIKKIGEKVAKDFTLKFGTSHFTNDYQLNATDYALVVKISYPKSEFEDFNRYSATTNIFYDDYIKKLRLTLYLSIGGYFSIGQFFTYTTDWPIIQNIGSLPRFELSLKAIGRYNDLDLLSDRIKNIHKKIESISLKKISPLIDTSLSRLMKSKHSRNISDRTIELAIAFETMIATTKSEVVGLQIKIKLINLIHEHNASEVPFKKLSSFYDLRSTIVHGNSLVQENEKNKLIVDEAEQMIQEGLMSLIILIQNYHEKEIKEALQKSMYYKDPLSKLLIKENM